MWAVRPDVEIKSSPMFAKTCPKSGVGSLCLTKMFYKIAKKIHKIFGLLLIEKLLPGTFKIAQSGHTICG